MNWHTLKTENDLEELVQQSFASTQVIFKHSTSCSISRVVKNRLDKAAEPSNTAFHYLDLIAYRSISNNIAQRLNVRHESPQILVIRNGMCVYNESHYGITMDDIEAEVMNAG